MGFKKNRGRVTWYVNPASLLQTVVSVFATFKLLDIYSKRETGEGLFDGVKKKGSSIKEKISKAKN